MPSSIQAQNTIVRGVARGAMIVISVIVISVSVRPTCGQQQPDTESPQQPDAESPLSAIDWQVGPSVAKIGDIAELELPKGYQFAAAQDTQMLLELMQNPTSGTELGLLTRADGPLEWFVVFEFSDIGYVPDDEKDELDAEAMLESYKTGTEASNEQRISRGWAPLTIVGWEYPPKYDTKTNNLVWALRAESEGAPIVNYNTRILGRSGVMEANLVTDPSLLASAIPEFESLLTGYRYVEGERYAEFREGDKIAQYGLTALVTGGVAAAAMKAGLFKKFGKFIVLAVVAVGAFFKKMLGRGPTTVS